MEVKVSLIQESRDSYSFLLDSRWMNHPKGLKRNPIIVKHLVDSKHTLKWAY